MDLEEAEATLAKAREQIKKWSSVVPTTESSREHVRRWQDVVDANLWAEPGRAAEKGES
jgi:hypothetical protein